MHGTCNKDYCTTHKFRLALSVLACLIILATGITRSGHTASQQDSLGKNNAITTRLENYESHRAINSHIVQPLAASPPSEFKNYGFLEQPLSPSIADPGTELIETNTSIPLTDRTPVILIHGIHDNDPKTFKPLISYLEHAPFFNQRYKIYKFNYRSDTYSIYDIAASLRNRTDNLVRANQQLTAKQFVLIAHSMGGLVARSYMNQHDTDYGGAPFQGRRTGERVSVLITLGTPHHGSPLSNGPARVNNGVPANWLGVFLISDYLYWTVRGCSDCKFDLQHSNRGELLWDNFNGSWNSNSWYTSFQAEQNRFLQGMPHTYDYKIVAYWGIIGSNSDTNFWSRKGPVYLQTKIAERGSLKNEAGALNLTGVILQRVVRNDFTSTSPLQLQNDGFVPVESARFDRPSNVSWPAIKKNVGCQGYNHKDIRDNKSASCDDHRNLFDSILNEIQGNVTTEPGLLAVNPHGTYGNSTFSGGTATVAELNKNKVTTSALDIGTENTVSLQNLGGASVQVTSLSLSGSNPDQFTISNAPSLPFIIDPNSSVDITVQFIPTSAGLKTAALVAGNNSVVPAASADIDGFGLPAACDLSLNPFSRYIPVGGGSGSFNVPSIPCPWNATSDAPWLHMSVIGQTINYSVDSNTVGRVRFGQINIQVYGRVYNFDIVQNGTSSGCNLTISENQHAFAQVGGSGTFNVSTPDACSWSVSTDSPWIAVNTTGLRVGSQPVSYTVTANNGSSLRLGTITVQGQDVTQVFTITQDAISNTCAYSLSASEQIIPVAGSQNSFGISTGNPCPWQISTPDRWITIISSNNGTGSRTINYTVGANPSTSTRIGSISVQGSGSTLLLTVRQDGQPIVYPNISLPSTNIQMGDSLVNSTIYQGVVINNAGQGYLFLGSIYRSSGSTDFDILPYGQNQIIAPGGIASVTIRLTPTSTSSRSATFSISSNDPNTPTASFTISGNGVTQITGGIDFVWANKYNAPVATSDSAFVTLANNIYVLGGSPNWKQNYKYDPTTNSWTQISDAPYGCMDGGAVIINNKIYMVGDPLENRIQVYDPSTNSWTVGAKMLTVRSGFAYGAVNGKFYVIGGAINGNSAQTTVVEEYNPMTDAWSPKTSIPLPRTYAASAVVNGLIYVIGGDGTYGGNIGWPERDVQVFDPSTGTWSRRESLPSRRAYAAAAVLNNKIYLTGGYDLNGIVRQVDEFDPVRMDASNDFYNINWASRNPISVAREFHAAGAVNGKLYVVGGTTSQFQNATSQIEEGTLSASPKINLSVASFNCGDVPLGNFCDKRVEVQNEGNALLTISNWGRISGSTDFNAFAGTSSIDAGQSISLVVRFTPSSTGSKTATFTINSNDPSASSMTFNLAANAVAAPLIRGTWQNINTIQLSNPSLHPTHVAIANGNAYVTRGNASMSVVDLVGNKVVAEIPFTSYPNGQAQSVTVSGNRAYVVLGNLIPGQLAVVNTDNNAVLSYIPVSGAHPYSVAATDTRVYVPNAGPDTVSVIDPTTNSITNTIPVSAGAVWITIDSSSGKAYVTGNKPCGTTDGGCISVIDTATNSVVSTISIPTPYSSQYGIALTSTRAYFLTEASVEAIDLSSSLHVASIPVPRYANGSSIAVTPEYVFVGSGYISGAGVSVISTSANFIVGNLGLTDPNNIAIDPATGLVYVLSYTNSNLSVLRLVAPGFSVSTNSQSLATTAGGNTAFTTTVSSIDGFSGVVSLSCEGLPTGSTCQFGQNPVTVPANASVSTTLTVAIPSGAIPGPYSLRVVGGGSAPQNVASNSKAVTGSAANTTILTDFQNVSLTVPSCDYTLSAQSISVGADTITGNVDVSGTTGCSWTAISNAAWISITSGASGSGNGTVRYSVAAITGATSRTGTLTIAGQTLTFNQSAATYTINGRVTEGSGNGIGGVTISLSGSQTSSIQTDSGGNYSFANLSTGNYTITPSRANYTFNPGSQTFNSLSSNQAANFTGTPMTFSIAGLVTIGNVGLGGVRVALGGSQSQTTTTDAGGTYLFTNVLAGGDYTITPSKTNYTFTPQNRIFSNLSSNQPASFTATINLGVPILISEETSTRAIALDSVVWLRDPFQLNSPVPWGFDRRTRVMLFAMNLDLLPGENVSIVTADIEDVSHRIYPLTVEYVGKVSGFDWLSCVIVRLNDDIGDIGDVLVRINARGVSSNRVRLGIGHTGGGPPDDPGVVPTPGQPPQ